MDTLHPSRLFFAVLVFAVFTGCTATPVGEGFGQYRLNELQFIGSHNSYKKRFDPSFADAVRPLFPAIDALDYGHPPVHEQLNMGIRSLEIDIHYDPDGGRYNTPLGIQMIKQAGKTPKPFDPEGKLDSPGFKVIHHLDFDYRSWHLDFADQLRELRDWSDANPGHLPVIITMNCKEGGPKFFGMTQAARFDTDAFDQLDTLLLDVLGRDKLLVPDDVRSDAASLEQAVLTRGWPSVEACVGRFMFVIDAGSRSMRRRYVTAEHEGLRGRVLFITSPPGTPEAGFLVLNQPLTQAAEIRRRVEQGYLVRTRSDVDGHEARANDLRRFLAAERSNAHIISTDFYKVVPETHPTYQVVFDGPIPYIRARPRKPRQPTEQ